MKPVEVSEEGSSHERSGRDWATELGQISYYFCRTKCCQERRWKRSFLLISPSFVAQRGKSGEIVVSDKVGVGKVVMTEL